MIGTAKQIIMMLVGTKDDGDKQYEIKEYKRHRSLSQNALYWKILSQVATKLKMSKAELHNRMLRTCGYMLYVDGQLATTYLPDTDETENKTLQMTTLHLMPTSQIVLAKDGEVLRTYVILRGSHDYNTEEMSELVDKILEEAEQQGIPTINPRDLEEIRAREKKAEERKKKNGSE